MRFKRNAKYYCILSKDYSKVIARITTTGLREMLGIPNNQGLSAYLVKHPDLEGYPIAEE